MSTISGRPVELESACPTKEGTKAVFRHSSGRRKRFVAELDIDTCIDLLGSCSADSLINHPRLVELARTVLATKQRR